MRDLLLSSSITSSLIEEGGRMPPPTTNHPTDLLGGFIWMVSEYRRTFLGLTVVFALAPISLCIFLLLAILGIIESPVLDALKEMSAQHQRQYESLVIHSRAIIDNHTEIKGVNNLVHEVIEGNDKNFKGQVANCFVAANGNREAIERCKELQRLE